ncbi:MAG: hypothetical protein QOH56_2233 [Pseudonocardiales bacterium]|nr:hypothetical protein [Pseudonocardiales bacterium]
MTDSYPPNRNAAGSVRPDAHPDHETTALPRVPEESSPWAAPEPASPRSGGSGDASASGGALAGFGSKLTAAGASAVAAATSAASSAREAVRGGSASPDATTAGMSLPQGATAEGLGVAAGASARAAASGMGGGGPGIAGSGVGGSGVGGPGVAATPRAAASGREGRSSRAARSTNRQPRKARLTLSHLNVYSIFKFSCVLAIALFFTWLIMIGVLYGILDVAGVLKQVNSAINRISGTQNPKDVVTGSIVFGAAIIIGAVYIVLFIAMSTIGSMIYNLCADLVGGVEVTLSERE